MAGGAAGETVCIDDGANSRHVNAGAGVVFQVDVVEVVAEVAVGFAPTCFVFALIEHQPASRGQQIAVVLSI